MNAASHPRFLRGRQRMLVIDSASDLVADYSVQDLPSLLTPGDLVVLNDAATLPAAIVIRGPGGELGELRLASPIEEGRAWAVRFSAGDWRQDTDTRAAPPMVRVGDQIRLPDHSLAKIIEVSSVSNRLLRLDFQRTSDDALHVFYTHGSVIQYSYLDAPLDLSAVQTRFAGRPWSVEMPSAGRPVDWHTLGALRQAGVQVATLTHAAGLSATGDPALDAALPLPESYDLPARTLRLIDETKRKGRQVLALGTTVVRALEGAVRVAWRPGRGTTDLKITPGFQRQVVDGLLSGVHEPGTSHYTVVSAFAPQPLVDRAHGHAARQGYLVHEFGDSTLVMPGLSAIERAA